MDKNKDEGYICECCGAYNRRWQRRLNSNMALCLIILSKRPTRDFVHLEDLMIQKGFKRCGDASYLVHWGFLERKPELRDDGSKRNGHYRITDAGIDFAKGKIDAPERAYIFRGVAEHLSVKRIGIKDALGTKFNYTELMYGL